MVSGLMGVLVLALGIGICDAKVKRILKKEPLYLLEDGMAGK